MWLFYHKSVDKLAADCVHDLLAQIVRENDCRIGGALLHFTPYVCMFRGRYALESGKHNLERFAWRNDGRYT